MSYRFGEEKRYMKRRCYKCNRPINFGEFLIRNRGLSKERVIKLWENNHIEFYCCLCYNKMKKERKLKKKREVLSKTEKNAIDILEKRLNLKLNIIPVMRCNSLGFLIENGKITGLGLYMRDLMEIPEEIKYLKSLKNLNLSWNHIQELPEFIFSLPSLRILDLIGNKLKHISPNINKLEHLEELDLSFNNLRCIPHTIANLKSLKVLNLIHNKLLEIPEPFQNLERKVVKILI